MRSLSRLAYSAGSLHRQPNFVRLRMQQGGLKGPGRGSRLSGQKTHRPGDTVRQSGIYEVIHDGEHRSAHEVVMISGDHFPNCETCDQSVRFRLVRTAPYIFQDQDFEEEK